MTKHNLTGVACEDACHDSLSVRDFAGCWYRVPDACDPRGPPPPPGGERRREGPARRRGRPPRGGGPAVRGGSVAGATTMEAPGPPESASGSRDPETRLAKRGNQWHLGARCHPGKDAGSGHAREAHGLVRDDDGLCHADAIWRGARQARGGPLGPAPLQGRLARRHGPLQARGIPALLASANLPVCARAGRQGEFLGASVAAA